MERWTIKDMNSMSERQFIRAILNERLNKLNPYTHLAIKLKKCKVWLNDTITKEEG